MRELSTYTYTELKVYLKVLHTPSIWGREMLKEIKKGFDVEAEKVKVLAEMVRISTRGGSADG